MTESLETETFFSGVHTYPITLMVGESKFLFKLTEFSSKWKFDILLSFSLSMIYNVR